MKREVGKEEEAETADLKKALVFFLKHFIHSFLLSFVLWTFLKIKIKVSDFNRGSTAYNLFPAYNLLPNKKVNYKITK